MSRFHPSWPSPLLALDPIRLRPMGWLDDLLPMRPPSLWRDRSLYARALRWQPDMADLSWLFDAYAMLGIEMPPPRIEHRTHQRSPQRGRLKGNARPTKLRRRRAPIKGANRPLAIPRWSSPPQMVAPSRTETQERVDSGPAFRSRRTVAPPNLAKSFGSQPTLLQRATPSDAVSRTKQPDTSTESTPTKRIPSESSKRSRPETNRPSEVLKPRRPRVQRFPQLSSTASGDVGEASVLGRQRTPPPKVTWQQGHTRSPWRLNQTGRTLFNPQAVISQPSTVEDSSPRGMPLQVEPSNLSQGRLTAKVSRIDQPLQRQISADSDEIERNVSKVLSPAEQIEWNPTKIDGMPDGSVEQGKVRMVAPPVPMELPPSPRKDLEESSTPKYSSDQSSAQQEVLRSKSRSDESPVEERRSETKPTLEPIVRGPERRPKTTAPITSSSSIQSGTTSESEVDQPRQSNLSQPITQREFNRSREQVAIENRRSTRKSIVQVPTRVPWRLRRSVPFDSVSVEPNKTVPDQSVNTVYRQASTPVSQQVDTPVKRQRIPQVASWFLPQRQRLIEHFQTKRSSVVQRGAADKLVSSLVDREVSQQSAERTTGQTTFDAISSKTVFSYNFASPRSSNITVFRAQEQTMVAPIAAGTLVFPTPVIQDSSVERTLATAVEKSNRKRTSPPAESTASKKTDASQVQVVSDDRSTNKEVDRPTTKASTKSIEVEKSPGLSQRKPTASVVPSESVSKVVTSSQSTEGTAGSRQENQYPESFVQSKNVYQRRSVQATGASWRLRRTISSDARISPVTKALQKKAEQKRWRQPYIPMSEDRSETNIGSSLIQTPSQVSTSKSVFRAPSTFWQGSFTQNRGSVQLQSPMVFTTPSSESVSPTTNFARSNTVRKTSKVSTQRRERTSTVPQWLPKQILDTDAPSTKTTISQPIPEARAKVPSSTPSRTLVRSVSWRRKPTFPDPFVAHRRSILPPQFIEVNAQSSSSSDRVNESGYRSSGGAEVVSELMKSRVLQAPQSTVAPVRRVVAPTLSAAIVYNSTSPDTTDPQTGRSRTQNTKFTSQTQNAQSSDGTTNLDKTRPKSIGKYAPNRSQSSQSLTRVESEVVSDLSLPNDEYSAIASVQERDEATVFSDVEQEVQKTIRRLVHRLPGTQQSLLRSQISLSTRWAKKLGIAPTAEVRMGWQLQRALISSGSLSPTTSTPRLQTDTNQFAIPSGVSSDLSSPNVQRQPNQIVESTPSKRSQTPTVEIASQTVKRRLSNTQINRIIERQVAFFRSAQRQSFLKAVQMTESVSSSSVPSPARGGLQQVTGEMRKALQKMVFSSESKPLFLDSMPEIEATSVRALRSEQRPESVDSRSTSKIRTVQRPKRLGIRTPQWRPGVHTPASSMQHSRLPSVPKANQRSGTSPIQTSSSVSDLSTASVIVPNTAPMTILQTDDSTSSSQDLVSTDTNAVESSGSANKTSISKTASGQWRVSKGRSSTVAPKALMGKSDVGVFLQPKRKATESEEPILKSSPQSANSVDSEADVFMVDPTGNLLTGEKAKKRLKELGFARTESAKPKKSSAMDASSGSYTWQAPAEMMEEAVKQVRKEMSVQENVQKASTSKPRVVRQSVIKEWTEDQLLTILVELASSSPEANALLRDVQERVEEYFDLERFRKI